MGLKDNKFSVRISGENMKTYCLMLSLVHLCFESEAVSTALNKRGIAGAGGKNIEEKDNDIFGLNKQENNIDATSDAYTKESRHAPYKGANTSNKITFKDNPDSSISGSSHSRGYNFYQHGESPGPGPGYGLQHHGFEGGVYDDKGFDYYHEPDHHTPYIPDHGPHHHHGHDHHGLAVKSFLLPLAGIALLGAAAALVTNPILLQLGVVSGRRRKRSLESTPGIETLSDQIPTPRSLRDIVLGPETRVENTIEPTMNFVKGNIQIDNGHGNGKDQTKRVSISGKPNRLPDFFVP